MRLTVPEPDTVLVPVAVTLQTVALLPVTFTVPLVPKFTVLLPEALFDVRVLTVIELPLMLSVPVTKLTAPKLALPPNNTVCVPAVILVLVEQVKLPALAKVSCASIADTVRVVIVKAVSTVAVQAVVPVLELASKMATSAVPGTDAPPAPPDVVDHLLVSDQLPSAPTQYLFAILNPYALFLCWFCN